MISNNLYLPLKLALVLGKAGGGAQAFDETPSVVPPGLFSLLISSSGYENNFEEVYARIEVDSNITKGSFEVKADIIY